jgi:hypothetical protein
MESKTIITLNSTKGIVNLVKNVMRFTHAYPILAVKKKLFCKVIVTNRQRFSRFYA